MIKVRQDGTYVIDYNGYNYHVIEADVSKWAEVQQRIAEGEEVQQDIPEAEIEGSIWDVDNWEWVPPLSYAVSEAYSAITTERDRRINAGFTFDEAEIQADATSQAIAHQFLTKELAGLNTYPIIWRTKDNQYIGLEDATELNQFVSAMIAFVQGVFSESWAAKDDISAATTAEEIDTILSTYMEG